MDNITALDLILDKLNKLAAEVAALKADLARIRAVEHHFHSYPVAQPWPWTQPTFPYQPFWSGLGSSSGYTYRADAQIGKAPFLNKVDMNAGGTNGVES